VCSSDLGLLWPNFTGTFGGVFGLGFTIEGFSFFLEAIFIGIYVYGWNRLSPRLHLLSGIPVVVTGFTGSLMVISVNAWMNHPGGFHVRHDKVVDVHPLRALFGKPFRPAADASARSRSLVSFATRTAGDALSTTLVASPAVEAGAAV